MALPSDEAYSLEHLAASVKLVDEAISGFDRWRIDGEVLLGIFDFTKYTLYEDLEKNREAVKAHPLIKAINGDPSALRDPPESPRAEELDEAVPPKNVFQVLEADSSQQEAIEAAKRGVDFVLQGPPGTGKSQTISNIIAEKLAAGETVLFVSEKQAALDVVKSRLDDIGLGRFCLEAHGEKANKEAVLQSLASELRSNPIRYPSDRDDVTSNLASVRRELNQYGDLLFTRPGGGETTVYDAMGRVAQHPDAPSFSLDLEAPSSTTIQTSTRCSTSFSACPSTNTR
ncbi:AAA domain-containing protein [Saliphagus sp. GCM10025308]